MKGQLLDYQWEAAANNERALREHRLVIDTSDTGVGKSYVTAHVLSKVIPPTTLVVCPKAVITPWKKILDSFGVEAEVINYEKLRTGRTKFGQWVKRQFEWDLPEDAVVVWDEAHRLKGDKTKNSKMAKASKKFRNMLLSATLAESPLDMRVVGYLSGLHSFDDFWVWCRRNGCKNHPFGGQYLVTKERDRVLRNLHSALFPKFGSRIKIADLGDKFPPTQISAECYDLDQNIGKIYAELEVALKALPSENYAANALVAQLRARQHVELLKVPGLISMAKDYQEQGFHVVLFVNFIETLCQLQAQLKCPVIRGGQSQKERDQAIDVFQENQVPFLVCQTEAGGTGVSLHDIHGGHPRVSLISPQFSAKTLRQILGRVHRAGGKTKSLQRIVFAANSLEEDICESVNKKLRCLDLLNDGDFLLNKMNEVGGLVSESADNDTMECQHDAPILPISTNNLSTTLMSSLPDMERSTASTAEESPSSTTHSSPQSTTTISGPQTASSEDATSRGHAKHSPSSLKQKIVCPGWQNDPEPNEYRDKAAERGTRGHEAWELGNVSGLSDDPVLQRATQMCIDYTSSFKGTVFREERIRVLDQYGYFDCLIVNGKKARLQDAKFSHNWFPADSIQFWAYCVGIWEDSRWAGVEEITVETLHPFLEKIDQHTFTKTADFNRLKLAVFNFIEAAKKADPSQYKPSASCLYCGKAGKCEALARFAMEVANRYEGAAFALPEGSMHGSEITNPATFAVLLKIAPIVKKAAEGWSRAAQDLWQIEGIPIPGYQLLERTGKRSVTIPRVAYDFFLDNGGKPEDFIDVTSVSITELEDLVGSLAPKGKKGALKQAMNDLLTDREAISYGANSFYLKEQKKQD